MTSPPGPTAAPTATAAARRRLALAFAAAFALALALALASPGADADDTPDGRAPALLEAVVGVDAVVPPNARTADTLGTRRQGSGVVISDDGLVATIGYLIMEASSVDIVLASGRTVPAEIVGYDHRSGLGLLRALSDLAVAPIALGTAETLGVRGRVLVANRLGPQGAQGVFVVDRRVFAGSWEYLLENAIFTSPPNPNFSGAALLGPDGALVGIGYLFVGNAAFIGRPVPGNMFVPVDELTAVLDDLVAKGRRDAPPRPWLGVYTTELRGRVFVERIAEGGPATRAGLEPGDMIVSVGGREISDMESYFRTLWDGRVAGDPVDLSVLSPSGGTRTVTVSSIDRREWLRLDPTL